MLWPHSPLAGDDDSLIAPVSIEQRLVSVFSDGVHMWSLGVRGHAVE